MVASTLSLLATVTGAAHARNYSRGAFPSLSAMKGTFTGYGSDASPCKTHKAGSTVKDAIDYESIMNPIRDQGECGSCFIFAAVAVMEASTHIDLGKKVEISEQQSNDCGMKDFDSIGAPDFGSCAGGLTFISLLHYTEAGVNDQNPAKCVCSRKSYPYLGDILPGCSQEPEGDCWHPAGADGQQHREPILQQCQEDDCECALPAGSVEDCYEIPVSKSKHVAALKEALNHRPVAISVNGDLIGEFMGGDYNKVVPAEKVKCNGTSVDHAVVAVGYGTDADGTQYWKIRNSWGTEWGEKGYLRVAIVDDDEGSLCMNTAQLLGVYAKMTADPTPTPPLDYPICAEVNGEVKYDWLDGSSHRSCCCNGCDFDTCEQKILDGTAEGHCYTQAQVNAGKVGNGHEPHGCNYGSAANTCAFDANNQCVYSEVGSSISV